MIKGFAWNIWEHNLMMVAWGKGKCEFVKPRGKVNVLGKLRGSKRTRLCLGSKCLPSRGGREWGV